jgi:hypothetical protein
MKLESIPSPIETSGKTACAICDSHKQLIVTNLVDVPLLLGCVADQAQKDRFISFTVLVCSECGLITTDVDTSDASLYDLLHSEAVGAIWQRHRESLANYISESLRSGLEQGLEIGPSNNPLLRNIKNKPSNISYCDILKQSFELRDSEQYYQGMFPLKFKNDFDCIIASHVFEHASNMSEFYQGAMTKLKDGASFTISIPNFETWIAEKYWNAITPEHNNYPFLEHLEYLAVKSKSTNHIQLFEKHSVFARFSKNPSQSSKSIEFNPSKSITLLQDWVSSINNSITKMETQFKQIDKSSIDGVFIAGASHLAQYPLLCSTSLMQAVNHVIDNSPSKENHRLYGTNITCKRFEYISNYQKPLIMIFASPYQEEMAKQVKDLNSNAELLLA